MLTEKLYLTVATLQFPPLALGAEKIEFEIQALLQGQKGPKVILHCAVRTPYFFHFN